MKTAIIFLFLYCTLNTINLYCQNYCMPGRFTNEYYFQSRDIQVDKDIIYGHAIDENGKTILLDLDVFYPKFSVDNLKQRPFIMLIHGGGGNKTSMYRFCPLFAERGFVIATITYRTQLNGDPISGRNVYQSIQDAHAALRYLVSNEDKYGIDTNAIFIGGQSLGAVSSTSIAYLDQQDFDVLLPNIEKIAGRIDNSTNNLKTKFKIRGVIDMWGQIADTSFISSEEAHNIPIIMFHGTADSSYVKSVQISKRFKNLGGCYQLHTKTGAGHGQNMSKYYIAAKASCFIKSIFCGSCYQLEREINNKDITCDLPSRGDSTLWVRNFKPLNIILNKQFNGEFRYLDEDRNERVLIVSSENGHLFFCEKGDTEKTELFPESENDFYIKDFNAQISFNLDVHRKVIGLRYYIDAQEIFAKKK